MEAKLAETSQAFLKEAFPEGALSLLLTPSGPERESLLVPLLLHGLRGEAPLLAVLSNTSPTKLLTKLASAGGEAQAALKEGRLHLLDWYSHKEGGVKEAVEEGGILRCPGSLEALEEAMARLLDSGTGRGLALLEFLTDATWFGKERALDLVASLRDQVLKAYGSAVLVLDGNLVAPDMVERLEGMAVGMVHVHLEETEVGPAWKASVRREGKEVADHFLAIRPPFVEFTIVAEPEEASSFPAALPEEPPEREQAPCPQCGGVLEEEQCVVCGYAAEGARLERVGEILQQCEDRLAEDARDLDALFTKAVALARLREFDEAIETLNAIAKHDPRYPALWMLKAKIYERVGDDIKAKLCRQRALELEDTETESVLAIRVGKERFQCPLCQRWLPMDANACPCGAEFTDEEGP